MGQRRRAREFALQMLYQIDQTGDAIEAIAEPFWDGQEAAEDVRRFAESLVAGVLAARADLDLKISHCSEKWRVDRMAVVDRNILRLAAYELGDAETPPAVVIDEAIEIAKRFSSAESARFINGVLDELRLRREEAR